MPFQNKCGSAEDCPCGLVFHLSDLYDDVIPVLLKNVSINSKIIDFVSEVTVTQSYVNVESNPIEVVYMFPIEEEAAVISFEAEVDNRKIFSQVKEKDKARNDYDDAMRNNRTAVLLEETQPDIFQIKLGQLKPQAEATIMIKYVSELPVEDGKVKLTIPTTIAPRYVSPRHISEDAKKSASIPYSASTPAPLSINFSGVTQCKIKSLKSPSHEFTTNIGDSINNNGQYTFSGDLSIKTTDMDRDIILYIEAHLSEELNKPMVHLEKPNDKTPGKAPKQLFGGHKSNTSGFTLGQAIACAVQFDDQHCGIYAGDQDSYVDFKDVFEPLILEYHGLSAEFSHQSDMDVTKIQGNVDPNAPVHSTRIRVGRSIEGFGLSPGITRDQRLEVEKLMINAFAKLKGELAGTYYPLLGMEEATRQKLVDDHLLFVSGDKNLIAAGMERDWPEGRGIFHNEAKTFLTWVNEEDQLRIISMQKGGDVKEVFSRLANGIMAVQVSVKEEAGKNFQVHEKYGYLHSCPTNLGTGMRASVHLDLPGWNKEGLPALKTRCEELNVQPRGTRGESGGQTGVTYDISNKHRLGYSEVELVQCMIDGVNTLYKEDVELQKKHGLE